MKTILLASVATTITAAFMSEVCDVVLVNNGSGAPVRVNRDDFDADQASDNPQWTEYKGKLEPEQSIAGMQMTRDDNAPVVAAPSAPDFSAGTNDPGATTTTLPIDPEKNAVAPAAPSPNQRLVNKEGKKWYIVDGNGAKITGLEGVDEKGYASEADAWAAVMALPH